MKEFIKIAEVSEIPERSAKHIELDGLDIAVYKISGELFVINNLCPHQHAPVLSEGILEGYNLTCPLHGWIFDLKTGESVNGQSKVKKFVHKIEGDDIFIEVNRDLF